MAFVEMFFWWYARGWQVFIHKIRGILSNITDFFSMDSLIRTLFQPFRQISANSANADSSLDMKFQIFLDRFISRLVGFFTRLLLLIVGSLIIIFGGIVCLFLIILWPVIPLFPIIGIILSIMGVMAWCTLSTLKTPVSGSLNKNAR